LAGLEQRRGAPLFCPTGRDLLEYVHAVYEAVSTPGIRESAHINNMKKYVNFIGLGAALCERQGKTPPAG
jgi:tRNA-dihydrouridine synthase B